MQKMFLAIAALCAFALAASSEVPLGLPLIEKETSGGFVPEDMQGWGVKITIYPNGTVFKAYKANYRSAWEYTLLATLSNEAMTDLETSLVDLVPGEIVFPDEPECTDVPTTTYSARNNSNVVVNFATLTACRLGVLEDYADSYRLKKLLDGLGQLGSN
jgi:hypothetical protein